MCEVNCINCIVTEFKDDLCEEEFCKKFKCARGSKDFIEYVLEVAMPHGEWIPCSERLPEDEGKYLVSLNYGDVTMDSFIDGMFIMNLINVVAWMPLPEPYKKEG